MKTNLTLLSQIINSLNRDSFNKIVKKYESDKHSKGINSWTHFVSMLFCHTAKANSNQGNNTGIKINGRKSQSSGNNEKGTE